MSRRQLPDRRPSVTRKVIWQTDMGSQTFFVTLGICPDTSEILEVFYADGQRTGSQLQHSVQDACVLISLLLQNGVSPPEIGKSLGQVPVMGAERPASIVGALVEAVAEGL